MESKTVNRASLCRNTIFIGVFGGIISIILGVITFNIILPISLLFFLMGILLISQVQTTHVSLKDNQLMLKTFGIKIREVDIDNIKSVEHFKYHNCFIDTNKSRIFSFNIITKDGEDICFRTGCVRGCALIEMMKTVYKQAFDEEFDLLECENELSHLPN